MTASSLIKEISKLSVEEKLLLVEKTLKTIRLEREHSLALGVAALYNEYKNDKELTAFTKLDAEAFYEAR
jgi:hypothetical protein